MAMVMYTHELQKDVDFFFIIIINYLVCSFRNLFLCHRGWKCCYQLLHSSPNVKNTLNISEENAICIALIVVLTNHCASIVSNIVTTTTEQFK